ncbi:Glycosyltransferase [Paraburkholderia piptadeniae]|uniref:Glycosyltransferase n=1 Tax=Paraburkholderia piptadeniae TaxID=1701573 RepID=A0A1N7RZR6_9BURK|nr:glycosyltransferase family 4 protein [Paraburkholderia piptadeniae]SIT40563.1 Glycosyltransferase [Paraburkholderia piptadeniae]
MLKIGISANALKYSGGLERYAMDLVRGFAGIGIEPAFFARRFDMTVPESGLVERHRIPVSLLPGKWRDAWFSARLRRARRAARVDVLIGCNRVDSSDIAICGGTHIGFLRATRRATKRSDRRQIELEKRQYERSAVIVAHSDLMRDELIELYGVDEAKIEVIYPPVDATRFTPVDATTRAALRKRYGFADDEIVLLFPSSSHQRKGLPLIEAALREIDPRVVVAVAGRPLDRPAERIRHIGYVREIEDCYRAADFTILASGYEPFGLVGVESVMCGTPVIFPSTIGCCSAIAGQAKFVFAHGDVAALRVAIERAVTTSSSQAHATGGPRVPAGSVLYDTSVAAHVATLLKLAQRVSRAR